MDAGEVAEGSFAGDGLEGTPSMLLPSGTDSWQRQGVHLGGVLVEILQWWWVGWWFQVREVEDLHGQVLPSCCPNLDNSGQFCSLVDSRKRHGVP